MPHIGPVIMRPGQGLWPHSHAEESYLWQAAAEQHKQVNQPVGVEGEVPKSGLAVPLMSLLAGLPASRELTQQTCCTFTLLAAAG